MFKAPRRQQQLTKIKFIFVVILVAAGGLISCAGTKEKSSEKSSESVGSKTNGGLAPSAMAFQKLADNYFFTMLNMSPEGLASFGKKDRYGELDDLSEAQDEKQKQLVETTLKELHQMDCSQFDADTKLGYELLEKNLNEFLEGYQWKDYNYPVNQQGGLHSSLPVFMINIHKVDTEKDLQDYISRLLQFPRVFQQTIDNMKRSESKGVIPPKFVYPYVIVDSQKIIHGKPFEDKGADSALYGDFMSKMKKLKLSESNQKKYEAQVVEALKKSVEPAYKNLIAFLQDQQKRAKKDDGAWKFPRGKEFYNFRLRHFTTTKMTANEIHNLGLQNVARLRQEMTQVKNKLEFKGDLKSFFKSLREDPKQYFENTDAGRGEYLKMANGFLSLVQEKVPQYFRLLPKAPMEIRRVEPFREASAGKAFYDGPSDDGSRPGIYYVNLQDMKNAPKFEAEALLYHEGVPGHHFQIALGIESKNLPMFRRYGHFTSYVEGWGLYAERLGKDMGGYKDLYSEMGRLSMEMIRACRLVVDTGIHSKKWTREKGIAYMAENLPVAEGMQREQVERFIIWPGQATAYMVGMLKIYQLRERAQKELGAKFDFRDFHEVILASGAVPLDTLEKLVNEYIAKKKT